MGQRAVKSVDGGSAETIHFIYDQAGQVIAEIDAATGMTLREYIYVNGVQVALVDDTGTQDEAVYFVHTDHLATPQKITDSAQTVVWSGSYEPFGEVEETVNLVENNIRFPGQYADGETGLHYNYFRDYDPSLGRYVESDPIGLIAGNNTFVYVGSNSIVFSDRTGLICWVVPLGPPSKENQISKFEFSPQIIDRYVISIPSPSKKPRLPVEIVIATKWQEITLITTVSITTQQRYLRCEDVNECGEKTITPHWMPNDVRKSPPSTEYDTREWWD